MRIHKFYSPSKYPLYNNVLSTVVAMLCIRSLDLIHFITENLHPFTTLSQFLPFPAPWQLPLYTVSMSLFVFRLHPYVKPCSFFFVWQKLLNTFGEEKLRETQTWPHCRREERALSLERGVRWQRVSNTLLKYLSFPW